MKKEKQDNVFKNYEITFTIKNKYNPTTRTITVGGVKNEYSAIDVVHREHGSFKYDKKLMMQVPTDKIRIDKIQEVKEFKNEKE